MRNKFASIVGAVIGMSLAGCNELPKQYLGTFETQDGKMTLTLANSSAVVTLPEGTWTAKNLYYGKFETIYSALKAGERGVYVSPVILFDSNGEWVPMPAQPRNSGPMGPLFKESDTLLDAYLVNAEGQDREEIEGGVTTRAAEVIHFVIDLSQKRVDSLTVNRASAKDGELVLAESAGLKFWSISWGSSPEEELTLNRR